MLSLAFGFVLSSKAQEDPSRSDRFAFTTIIAIPFNDQSFDAGYSIYSAVWPFLKEYPNPELFQTGLVSVWMTPQPTGREPSEGFYNTIEGGLGWWTDLRFGHSAPKFTMGGVSNDFFSWANGPGAGQAEKEDGFRNWDQPNGLLDIAQLSNKLLWPPDGLNMALSNNGEFLGYGYMPLPLTEILTETSGEPVVTGNQSWTLFLNSANFKGPAAFFLPTFWTKPVLEDPSLEGLFLDSRPSDPVHTYGFETATLPAVHVTQNSGNALARVIPTQYPASTDRESILLNSPLVYSRSSLWNAMKSWFQGGSAVSPGFAAQGIQSIRFDTDDTGGSAFFESRLKLVPGTETETDEFNIEEDYLSPTTIGDDSWGFRINPEFVENNNGRFVTPEYFELNATSLTGIALAPSELPSDSGLIEFEFEKPANNPQPYLTPFEADSQWFNPSGVWSLPGPAAGPFFAELEDGSRVTYYWYLFKDQPALRASGYSEAQREEMQRRIELIHSNWKSTDDYLPAPTTGSLARLDPGLLVTPPAGMEIGYVPIVTRQAKSDKQAPDNSQTGEGVNAGDDSPATSQLFAISPNPSSISIQFSENVGVVWIYAMDGSVVRSAQSTKEIDVTGLSSGFYVMRIQRMDGSIKLEKIILR